jgi:hypothetical protein
MKLLGLLIALLAVVFNTPEASARRYHKPLAASAGGFPSFQFFQQPPQFAEKRHVKVIARAAPGGCFLFCELRPAPIQPGKSVRPKVRHREIVHHEPLTKQVFVKHHHQASPKLSEVSPKSSVVVPPEIGHIETSIPQQIAHPHFAWCGWWMQIRTGITSAATKLNLNRAIEWAQVGKPSPGPCVNCIMVERHHVSQITRVIDGRTVIAISGNDGHRIRERIRRINRAVAFRQL